MKSILNPTTAGIFMHRLVLFQISMPRCNIFSRRGSRQRVYWSFGVSIPRHVSKYDIVFTEKDNSTCS